ncbi:MAG: hypothetical protein KDC57_06770 [Saprospiraceae bacterium]|nr:hypothetical protein [Saprospiraceae bacterium]
MALVLSLAYYQTTAQRLEQFDRSTPVALSGSLSLGTSFYQAQGIDNRRSPFAYYITAAPVITLYGFDIPLSFTYRDQQGSLSTPFNRFTINPSYKWASLQLGNTSVQWHPYVLSGQIIKGAALELTPGIFRFAATYGVLENPLAQIDTLVEGALLLPTYRRQAMAVKLGVGKGNNFVDLTAFRAKDDISSGNSHAFRTDLIKPEENLVLGISAGISPLKIFTIKANVAANALTSNQKALSILDENSSESLLRLNELFTLNISSKLQFAGDLSADLNFKNIGLGVGYKRVDPAYKSLGTYYFLEDYENYTFKLRLNLWGNRLTFAGQGGIQQNNLNGLRKYTNNRKIANLNVSVRPFRFFTVTGRYANFQDDQSPGLLNIDDTIRLAKATTSFGLIPRFQFGKADYLSTVGFSINYQELNDLNVFGEIQQQILNYNAGVNYSLSFKPADLQVAVGLLGTQNEFADRESTRVGGTLSFKKRFFNHQFTVRPSAGYFQNRLNRDPDGTTLTIRVSLEYRKKRQYTLGLDANIIERSSPVRAYREFRGTMKFSYYLPSQKPSK